ncbi:hypothetical protein XELAEV_18044955mg [Xenopus laevis]|uniref:Uncharacterized protein n=1 Tax=Xenopus laevis TaxID=8355 RepID=A0A974H494_XENLA|nr:hypothetical protein XELAEV_18044955mg [Xenopus laevis]
MTPVFQGRNEESQRIVTEMITLTFPTKQNKNLRYKSMWLTKQLFYREINCRSPSIPFGSQSKVPIY